MLKLVRMPRKNAQSHLDKVFTGDVANIINHLPDNGFDCIIFNDVLEHMLEPFKILEMLKGKLKEDGKLVASVPNVRYIKNLYHVLVEKDWHYQDEGILDRTHVQFFTKRSMSRSLQENKWNIACCKGINPTKFGLLFNFLNYCSFGFLADTKYMNYAFVCSRHS